jgi:hypothetical protein
MWNDRLRDWNSVWKSLGKAAGGLYTKCVSLFFIVFVSLSTSAYAHEPAAAQSWPRISWMAGLAIAAVATAGWVTYFYWRSKWSGKIVNLPQKEIRAYKQGLSNKKGKAFKFALIATVVSMLCLSLYAFMGNPKMSWEDLRTGENIDVETFADQGRDHLQAVDQEHIEYNSAPPTSGPHHIYPSRYGFYEETIEPEVLVHNLEHGDIVIYYHPQLGAETMDHLKALSQVTKEGSGVVVVPFPDDSWTEEVIATAWTQMMRLPQFDEAKLETFMAKYLYEGPEKLPPQH